MTNERAQFPQFCGLNSRSLAKAIFNADVPEKFIQTIPAQSLYLTVKYNGLASSADLLEIATLKQCRLLIDFDCWQNGNFNEDNFWEWLAITDATSSLIILEKLVRFIDLKLIAMLIAKYVRCVVQEEPTDHPPGASFYTPDKGYTWLNLEIEDSTRQFLLGRLLALIFETDPELFYQLIAIPNVTTCSMLEEDSFQDRQRRLSEEGIPDDQLAFELNSPLTIFEAEKLLGSSLVCEIPRAQYAIQPLIYDQILLEPLSSLFQEAQLVSDLESELTMLINAAIVYWKINFEKSDDLNILTQQVKGTINIGLQALEQSNHNPLIDTYKSLGLAKIYRVGLSQLANLKKLALQIRSQLKTIPDLDPAYKAQIEAACHPFPHSITKQSNPCLTNSKPFEIKAIETLTELNSLMKDFSKAKSQ
jgi:hypothetical protein